MVRIPKQEQNPPDKAKTFREECWKGTNLLGDSVQASVFTLRYILE